MQRLNETAPFTFPPSAPWIHHRSEHGNMLIITGQAQQLVSDLPSLREAIHDASQIASRIQC